MKKSKEKIIEEYRELLEVAEQVTKKIGKGKNNPVNVNEVFSALLVDNRFEDLSKEMGGINNKLTYLSASITFLIIIGVAAFFYWLSIINQ